MFPMIALPFGGLGINVIIMIVCLFLILLVFFMNIFKIGDISDNDYKTFTMYIIIFMLISLSIVFLTSQFSAGFKNIFG